MAHTAPHKCPLRRWGVTCLAPTPELAQWCRRDQPLPNSAKTSFFTYLWPWEPALQWRRKVPSARNLRRQELVGMANKDSEFLFYWAVAGTNRSLLLGCKICRKLLSSIGNCLLSARRIAWHWQRVFILLPRRTAGKFACVPFILNCNWLEIYFQLPCIW